AAPRPRTSVRRFPSLGEGVAHELEHLRPFLRERLRHGLRGVVDPRLLGERRGGEKLLAQPALHDLRAQLLGLVLHIRVLLVDRALGGELLRRDLVDRSVARRGERDVHRQPAREGGIATADPDEHADLVRRRVHVLREQLALPLLEPSRRLGPTGLDRLEDGLVEGQELVVLRDGLRLAADRHEDAERARDGGEHLALGRLAPGPLVGGGHAALAKEALGRLEVAVRLLERALALHHARARLVAEALDEISRDVGHAHSPSRTASATGAASGSVSSTVSAGPACSYSGASAISSAAGAPASAASASGASAVSSTGAKSSGVACVLPASIPSAIARTTRLHARIASSLPGIT